MHSPSALCTPASTHRKHGRPAQHGLWSSSPLPKHTISTCLQLMAPATAAGARCHLCVPKRPQQSVAALARRCLSVVPTMSATTTTAYLQQGERPKHSARNLRSSHTPGGHTQRQHARTRSDGLMLAQVAPFAHWNSVTEPAQVKRLGA